MHSECCITLPSYINYIHSNYWLWLDVPETDLGCNWIYRSPANLDLAECGYVAGSYAHGGCKRVKVQDTFTVQFCCGIDDCRKAGVTVPDEPKKNGGAILPPSQLSGGGGGSGSVKFFKADGTPINTHQEGTSPEKRNMQQSTPENAPIERRKPKCKKNSWVPDGASYTKPSPNTKVMLPRIAGPGDFEVSSERSFSVSHTLEAGLNIQDIFSIGTSFTQEQSWTEGDKITVPVADEGLGDLGFTEFLRCETGMKPL